jgi:predicted RNase H-like HicB family nuclease
VLSGSTDLFFGVLAGLAGCGAPGATREETERLMYEAIQLHVEGLIDDKQPIPVSTSFAEYVVVPA